MGGRAIHRLGSSQGYGFALLQDVPSPYTEQDSQRPADTEVPALPVVRREGSEGGEGMSGMTFKPYHMEQLRNLGMGGYPCATYAAHEIEQLNEYVYVLECALVFGFSNEDEVRQMITVLRELYAPDVDMPEVPKAEAVLD